MKTTIPAQNKKQVYQAPALHSIAIELEEGIASGSFEGTAKMNKQWSDTNTQSQEVENAWN